MTRHPDGYPCGGLGPSPAYRYSNSRELRTALDERLIEPGGAEVAEIQRECATGLMRGELP